MTVVSQRRGRAGWSERETNMLWDEVKTAGSSGLPLRNVFETVAHSTGRKPNSVRNYYYTNMKTGMTPPEIASLRVLPFMPFREGEAENLLRSVLTARSRGESVRACVLKLANGDRSLMLRYQNKYRALLRTQPATVKRIVEELRSSGIPCPDPCAGSDSEDGEALTGQCEPLSEGVLDDLRMIGDEEAVQFLNGLRNITRAAAQRIAGRRRVEENDRQNVRINLLRLELMRRDESLLNMRTRCEEAYNALLPLVCSARALIEDGGEDSLAVAGAALRPAEEAMDTLYNDVMNTVTLEQLPQC